MFPVTAMDHLNVRGVCTWERKIHGIYCSKYTEKECCIGYIKDRLMENEVFHFYFVSIISLMQFSLCTEALLEIN